MSKNQVIKKYVDIFNDFVKNIMYEKEGRDFLIELKRYYYKNKHFYIDRENITYNQFNTVLRQICKINNIDIEIKIKYENSKYSPEYHIFLNNINL